jgi:lipoate synthase
MLGRRDCYFKILGNTCTRSWWFCGVKLEDLETVDWDEPEKEAFNKNHEYQTCCNY